MNNALQILNSVFGYPSFRPPQQDIIDTLVAGGDALVLMPTGGGKSLCYQIPALVRPGCGVVISPLIALMQDQVDAMRQLGVRASYLNSTIGAAAARAVEQQALNGALDLLYIAPERLVQPRMLELLARMTVAVFAIDEAHCVSQWGHDFRADYLQLDLLHREFPAVPRIALTATADARTRADIVTRLDLGAARQFVISFDRPNIRYRMELKQNPRQQLLRFLKLEHPRDAGIVYCMSRRKTEDVAGWLNGEGFTALPYHAGLDAATRAANQSRFLREEGVIVVATIAFGMGIDKPDVRFVAHLDLPKTIESYYQESGRAGRDGLPANAWLIYGLQDVIKLRQMLDQSQGDERHRRAEQQRLNAMLGLCEITSCRREALLHYFGESYRGPCNNCDTCLSPVATWDGSEAARMALSAVFRTGQRFGVNHVIDVLRGSGSERARQFGHDTLPTYGLGTGLDVNQWRSVLRQLVARGYLRVDMDAFGALKLEERCRPLLRGEESLELRRDSAPPRAAKAARTTVPGDLDPQLWKALRECRRLLASEQGVPPYVIFHDSTLAAMCRERPRELGQMALLPGVGERKLARYGEVFLAALRAHQDSRRGGD
ncbi:MAG: DNA helicase RecQ [Pseudomonadales bacterium]|jgi:ATP-dependent DNA helicase RecQ|nr:DNA helicase RecQ [Gammaproteobacteria bacterium]MBK7171189.1 DNA helicase RecQ [Gammaproteobacteria bacterium]MBK9666486.1 DNA helicase RecQ [Gammaproteobacteria bacterium]MBP6052809.1 DNA helicase RecQ [Pseudomonadales bacterium]MBP6228457.1 DNA helicase RecQ [Pseudomonadales bacterium]